MSVISMDKVNFLHSHLVTSRCFAPHWVSSWLNFLTFNDGISFLSCASIRIVEINLKRNIIFMLYDIYKVGDITR